MKMGGHVGCLIFRIVLDTFLSQRYRGIVDELTNWFILGSCFPVIMDLLL
jgi:hypothetical protein